MRIVFSLEIVSKEDVFVVAICCGFFMRLCFVFSGGDPVAIIWVVVLLVISRRLTMMLVLMLWLASVRFASTQVLRCYSSP